MKNMTIMYYRVFLWVSLFVRDDSFRRGLSNSGASAITDNMRYLVAIRHMSTEEAEELEITDEE
jgi:hypothetical protein